MAFAEVVVNVEAGHHGGVSLARLAHREQHSHVLVQGARPLVAPHERGLRHGELEHARRDRVPLGLVRVEQTLR